MNKSFEKKLQRSIDVLQKSEKLALQYYNKGFYLAFSGGKDSLCLYHLAKLANVKFEAHYARTGIDHPELVHFIMRNYPDVVWDRPKLSFWQLVLQKKMLPTRKMRYCCQVLKETQGAGTVTLTGVRHAESAKRSKRNTYEVSSNKFSGNEHDFEIWRKKQQDQFSEHKESEVRCINGKDKIIINPIIDWTDKDVWFFIREVAKVEYCSLYDEGYHRLGCLFCPMASKKNIRKMERDYPKYKRQFLRTIQKLREHRADEGLQDYWEGMTNEDVIQWWFSKKSVEVWKYDNIYTKDLFENE